MKDTLATAKVFATGLAALQAEANKLNKRAAKHGMKPLEVVVSRELSFIPLHVGRDKQTGMRVARFGHQQTLNIVDIRGVAPRLNGWKLVAKIELATDIGVVVKLAPGVDDDGSFARYREYNGVCEHCNTVRRRKDVFVLQHENGTRKVVGRNCLADFLRCKSAEDFARYAEFADICCKWAKEAREQGDGFGGACRPSGMDLVDYLAVVAMLMRRIGWVSRTAARDTDRQATADNAYTYFYSHGRAVEKWIESNELWADNGDRQRALGAISWALTIDDDAGNEYLNTIKRIAQSGRVSFDGLDGYAASIIIAHEKAQQRERENIERKKAQKNRVHFGELKKRFKGLPVTCKGVHSHEGYYGVTTIIRFEHKVDDENVAILVWFASGDRYNEWEVDREYVIDATPKKHDDDPKWGRDTKINRVKDVTPH